jgi:hypothetical protein
LCVYSVTDSHNSRNAAAARPQRESQPVDAERARAQAWLAAFEHDPRNSQKWLAAEEEADALRAFSEADSHNSRNAVPAAVLSERGAPGSPIF